MTRRGRPGWRGAGGGGRTLRGSANSRVLPPRLPAPLQAYDQVVPRLVAGHDGLDPPPPREPRPRRRQHLTDQQSLARPQQHMVARLPSWLGRGEHAGGFSVDPLHLKLERQSTSPIPGPEGLQEEASLADVRCVPRSRFPGPREQATTPASHQQRAPRAGLVARSNTRSSAVGVDREVDAVQYGVRVAGADEDDVGKRAGVHLVHRERQQQNSLE